MFKRILVANRSEIAVRIIRACHELGIEAIAVYSEADREALHVQMADHSVCIGPPAARDSYLNVPNIMSAAMIHGCDAIHPGLGFLAENADFAEICETCGMTFIGPPVEAIGKMGDKARARRIMHEAGVPVIRGTSEAVEDEASILKAAADFGYPLRVKASLGGGGRGIRIVHSEEELLRSVQLARAEAKAAFGSPDVYLERDVQEPRHIEVQIMADKHGNVCHLWERECSVQTRFNQKLLEEAPAPRLGRPLRRRLADLAVHAAKAVGYVNAGTVEFLVDRYGNPFFLEMNTRLQVEHPITEMTTGSDIVKEQIRIAAGERLAWDKAPVAVGHAIECRIDARDTQRGFAPSPGRITLFVPPGGPGVRCDTHIYTGFEVTTFYDPLLAKVVVHGRDRFEAIRRMQRALREMRVEGIQTTRDYHLRILSNAFFRRGEVDTSFLRRHMGDA